MSFSFRVPPEGLSCDVSDGWWQLPRQPSLALCEEDRAWSFEQAGQEERDAREGDQQHYGYDVDGQEPENATEDRFERYRVADDSLDDEDIQSDGGCDQADLQHLGHQDAVPDQVDAEVFDRWQEHGQGQQHDADGIEEAAEEQQDDQRSHDQQHGADLALDDDFGNEFGKARKRKET